jgi:hypothetical protein
VLRNLTKVQRERRFQCSKKIIMCVPIYSNDDAHFVVKLPQKGDRHVLAEGWIDDDAVM